MAPIQPKNTDEILVNVISEKTPGANITLADITEVDDIRETTASAGVSLNQIIKFSTAAIPLTANIDIGTSTAAQHIREAFIKEITSNGQAISIGTDSAHSTGFKTNQLERAAFISTGELQQDATNGSNLLWTKASTALAQAKSTALTATGTIITDALDLTGVFNNLSTVAAGTGAQLWDAPIGARIEVRNAGANALLVYPHSGTGTINGGAGGASVSIASGSMGIFVRDTSTNWVAWEQTSAAA